MDQVVLVTDLQGDPRAVSICHEWGELDATLETPGQAREGADLVILLDCTGDDPRRSEAAARTWSTAFPWPGSTRVALVAEETPHTQVEALLRAGCEDVLALPFTPRDLDLRREVLRGARQRASEMAQGRVALRSVALHDGLTGLWSKSAGMGQLYREAARSARRGSPLTVAMLDIDFFRRVNNQYGHLCGDEALRTVAERLVGGVRPYDVVSRFGGEEFLVVSPDIAAAEGYRLVERLREATGEAPVPTSAGPLRVTLSAGLVDIDTLAREFLGRGGPDVLVQAADEALAKAKRSGRNHTVSWSPEVSRLVRATG